MLKQYDVIEQVLDISKKSLNYDEESKDDYIKLLDLSSFISGSLKEKQLLKEYSIRKIEEFVY